LELGTVIGFVAGTIFIVLSIFFVGGSFGAVGEFFDAGSVMIVFGGTVAATLVSVRFSAFTGAFKAIGVIFSPPVVDPAGVISQMVGLAQTARKEGILALEEATSTMEDKFLKKGIGLIVDATDPELVKDIMNTELTYVEDRHGNVAGIYEAMATYAPSWGMLGTMVGLVLMLGALDDPATIGPSMSIALVTTFYGCLLANFLCNPIAFK
jgi:chemotaxis protein MotA